MKPRKRRRRCSLGLGRVSLLSGNAAQMGGFQEQCLQRVKTSTGGVSDKEVHHLVFAHLVEACALKRRSQAATDGVQRNGIEYQQKRERAPPRSRKYQQTEKSPENTESLRGACCLSCVLHPWSCSLRNSQAASPSSGAESPQLSQTLPLACLGSCWDGRLSNSCVRVRPVVVRRRCDVGTGTLS